MLLFLICSILLCPETSRENSTLTRRRELGHFPISREVTINLQEKIKVLLTHTPLPIMRWQNRAHVLAWLESFNHPHALRPVFLDSETTGTQRFSEIIEVCIVNEYGQTLFQSLVNPTTEIEPMASAVHGLTRSDVKDAPRYPDIHEVLMRLIHNHVIVA